MASTDDSTSISSMIIDSDGSTTDVLPEIVQLRKAVDDYEDNDQDEGINDEPQLDDEEEGEDPITPIPTTNDNIPIIKSTVSTTDFKLHPLFEGDMYDIFSNVSTKFLAGASHELDNTDSSLSIITFHFFTDYIETETACQWQVCNKKPLTCQIVVYHEFYLDEKVVVKRVYQTCDCHPANAIKVPFIERLVRDFFEKSLLTMETLKFSRAASNPELRLKYFLEIIPDKTKRTQYEEMLLNLNDNSLLNELLDYEILDSNERIAKKLQLLKPPRENPSNSNIHYDLLDAKHLPKANHGYLVQFCKYIEYRMRNLNSLCVMCGKRTFDPNDKKASKPTICDDYECFSNAMDSKFRNDPLPPSIFSIEIADFLLLLVYAAIHSSRHELILDPYPKLINPYNTSTTLIDQNGNKQQNIEILKKIIDDIVTMGSITQYEVARISLRSTIELKHPWGFSFFHWLMGTNRYHFSLIPEAHRIKNIETKYQYFIKHEDIDKHVNFKNSRKEKGSIFAFHGSPQENWHSILRSGLQIGKGGYLLNGAAYGAGIYVSPSFQFSSGYTRSIRAHNYQQTYDVDYDCQKEIPPLDKRNWSCMALCEIIDSPGVYNKHSNDIWTIQDPNLICTRFIFFFPLGTPLTALRVDGDQVKSIRELIHTLNNTAC